MFSSVFRKIGFLILAPMLAVVSALVVSPSASAAVNVYTTPGYHVVNGREWNTTCSKYTSTIDRCRTEIKSGGKWVFNNLTYLPAYRSDWGSNPLANTGTWFSGGVKWRTECDTAVTGKDACRSYVWNTKTNKWVFNNIVMFKKKSMTIVAPSPAPAPTYSIKPLN